MLIKTSPKAISVRYCPELASVISEGYVSRFIPLPNGGFYCEQDGEYYDINDLEFFGVSVDSADVDLLKITASTGIKGFIIQRRWVKA